MSVVSGLPDPLDSEVARDSGADTGTATNAGESGTGHGPRPRWLRHRPNPVFDPLTRGHVSPLLSLWPRAGAQRHLPWPYSGSSLLIRSRVIPLEPDPYPEGSPKVFLAGLTSDRAWEIVPTSSGGSSPCSCTCAAGPCGKGSRNRRMYAGRFSSDVDRYCSCSPLSVTSDASIACPKPAGIRLVFYSWLG